MKKKAFLFPALLMLMFAFAFTACSNDDDSGNSPAQATGIPDNSKAGPTPYVNPDETNVRIPNVKFNSAEINGSKIVDMNITGILNEQTGEWLELYGTLENNQNIWMEIDGKPRSIKTERVGETRAAGKPAADVIFLVDNSGSMDEEADRLAEEIENWSLKLSSILDLKLGCVGYDGGINGAIDLCDYEELSAYLNRENVYGTSRTYGFGGDNANYLQEKAYYGDYYTWGECGAAALHYADSTFAFRSNANRLYVNFTDEPNQPGGNHKYSVHSVQDSLGWKVWKGTIHTVFSDREYYDEDYSWEDYYDEEPWLMSDYTGGTAILDAPSDFEGVSLENLPVTGALANSYSVKFHFTEDLGSGLHTVKIVILSPDGTVKGIQEFYDVDFSNL